MQVGPYLPDGAADHSPRDLTEPGTIEIPQIDDVGGHRDILAPVARSGAIWRDDDAGQLTVVETRAGARRCAGRQMSEASAIEDLTAERSGGLQGQACGVELVWRLGAGALRHRAGQARICEGAHLDRPIAARLGGMARLLPR